MQTTRITAAVLALTLGVAGLASAQPRDDRRGPDDRRGGPPQHQPGGPHRGGPDRGGPDRHFDQRGHDRHFDRRGPDRRADGRGAGPDHNWYRGDRLPPQYRGRQYVVDDWRAHRLSAPPRGYHWVQNGGDYVLIAIATGVIATLILNQ